MNKINTWSQGMFIDQNQYKNWTEDQKKQAVEKEKHLVRPEPLGNAICYCDDPDNAKWIASRLNLAASLENVDVMVQDLIRILRGN